MTKHKNVALDELRILAALMVLGVHTGQKVGLGDAAAVGAQGVQLFFVLSGYLAAASLSRHPEPLPYYQRRIRRILPLYWLVLVLRWLFDAVRYLAAGASAAQLFGPGGPCGPGYLRYFVFLQMWLPSDNWMLWNNRNVLWTMSAFAFFYLLAPWLYRLCKRFWGALALLVVCLAVKGRIGGLIESSLAAFPAEANISEFSAKTPVMTLYCLHGGVCGSAGEQAVFIRGILHSAGSAHQLPAGGVRVRVYGACSIGRAEPAGRWPGGKSEVRPSRGICGGGQLLAVPGPPAGAGAAAQHRDGRRSRVAVLRRGICRLPDGVLCAVYAFCAPV